MLVLNNASLASFVAALAAMPAPKILYTDGGGTVSRVVVMSNGVASMVWTPVTNAITTASFTAAVNGEILVDGQITAAPG